MKDKWNNAEQYESYMGRWSRMMAVEFLKWLDGESELVWIDVGCGTGALTSAILRTQKPLKVIGIDPSAEHVRFLQEITSDPAAEFYTSDAASIPVEEKYADAIVSGLVLNFVPDIRAALREFRRAAKEDAVVAAYVWDYAGKMELIRYFWDAAISLFEDAKDIDEAARFPICDPVTLKEAFVDAGFKNVDVSYIDIPTVFNNFDDYWNPFLSGIGPAPGYCMSLSEENRNKLREKIYQSLPINPDGRINLIARAMQ